MALILIAPPIVLGVVRRLKARMNGRTGPRVVQPLLDLARLLRKQPVVAEGTSWVLRAAPMASLAATVAAASLVPSFALGMATSGISDLLAIAGLLAVSRVSLALAAMDTGTAFGGIGASREMMFSVFSEPVFFLVVFTLALLAGTTNLDVVVGLISSGTFGLRISMALALVAALVVALVECGRIPVDNPATHLEVTMVHEAMVLEFSGRHLAMIELSAALRLLIWMSLIAIIFAPFGIAVGDSDGASLAPWLWAVGIATWVVKIGIMAAGLAAFETTRAKLRVFRVPEMLGMALLLGLLAAIFLFVSQGFA